MVLYWNNTVKQLTVVYTSTKQVVRVMDHTLNVVDTQLYTNVI